MTTMIDDEQLTETFAALANSTRRAILGRLALGAATVGEIAEPFNIGLPAISKHLTVLEHAGLVQRGRNATFRPCTIDASPIRDIASWAGQYRPIWEERFDRMEQHLQHLQNAQATNGTSDA